MMHGKRRGHFKRVLGVLTSLQCHRRQVAAHCSCLPAGADAAAPPDADGTAVAAAAAAAAAVVVGRLRISSNSAAAMARSFCVRVGGAGVVGGCGH